MVLVQFLANTAAQLPKSQIKTNLSSSGPPVGYDELQASKGGQLEAVRNDVAAWDASNPSFRTRRHPPSAAFRALTTPLPYLGVLARLALWK